MVSQRSCEGRVIIAWVNPLPYHNISDLISSCRVSKSSNVNYVLLTELASCTISSPSKSKFLSRVF